MRSSRSMSAYAVYLAGLAVSFVFIPNPVITLFGFAPTSEVWIRILGVMLGILAFFYLMAVREGIVSFYRWTVYTRLAVLPLFAAFVLLDMAPPVLLLFGVVDVAGALWTWLGLRSEGEIAACR